MMDASETQAAGALVSTVAMVAASVVDMACGRFGRRTSQLREAEGALAVHYAALDDFIGDPGAPPTLSEFLLAFSDAADDEAIATALVGRICEDDGAFPATPAGLAVMREIDALRGSRCDLADVFARALGSGLTAMFLRWDQTAAMFDQAAHKFTVNPGRELVVAATAVRAERLASRPARLADRMAAA